jgi:hypothetical protein
MGSNRIKNLWADVMVHTCNPSYLGGKGKNITNLRSAKTRSQKRKMKEGNWKEGRRGGMEGRKERKEKRKKNRYGLGV